MTSNWKSDSVKHSKNIPAKFHPNPVWNDGPLGFCEERHSSKNKKNNNKMSSDIGSVTDPKW